MRNNIKKNLRSFGVVLVLILVGYHFLTAVKIVNTPYENSKEQFLRKIPYITIAGQNISVDLAITAAEQSQGLSGREGLAENEGMLFIFDKPARHSFWMKDMQFAIDIIWLDDNMQVVYIKKDARPELYPETYGPDGNSKYVLEVVSGFADKHALQIGERMELFRN